jgi:hypothetical protein
MRKLATHGEVSKGKRLWYACTGDVSLLTHTTPTANHKPHQATVLVVNDKVHDDGVPALVVVVLLLLCCRGPGTTKGKKHGTETEPAHGEIETAGRQAARRRGHARTYVQGTWVPSIAATQLGMPFLSKKSWRDLASSAAVGKRISPANLDKRRGSSIRRFRTEG